MTLIISSHCDRHIVSTPYKSDNFNLTSHETLRSTKPGLKVNGNYEANREIKYGQISSWLAKILRHVIVRIYIIDKNQRPEIKYPFRSIQEAKICTDIKLVGKNTETRHCADLHYR
jgi:hypothetical protein